MAQRSEPSSPILYSVKYLFFRLCQLKETVLKGGNVFLNKDLSQLKCVVTGINKLVLIDGGLEWRGVVQEVHVVVEEQHLEV